MAGQLACDLRRYLSAAEMMRADGIEPDDWQRRFLLSRARRIIVNIHRQAGKTTSTAAKVLHHAISRGRRLALVFSPGLRQSGILFKKVLEAYRPIRDAFPCKKMTALQLDLMNGSQIVSLPGKEDTSRGFSAPSLIVVDEASRVNDALYYGTILPMLTVSDGQLILLSTPWGRRGFFFTAWHSSQTWERFRVTAEENPRISPTVLAGMRDSGIGDWWYSQEYLCEFRDASEQFFSSMAIDRAFADDAPAPIFPTDRLPGRVMVPDELEPLWGDE